jgi:hypothetical protein
MGKSFVVDTPFERLQHYPRYLKAIGVRLDKLKANPARDAQLMAEYGAAVDQLRTPRPPAGQAGHARSADRAVPLAAGGIARRPVRAGTADAGAGLGEASAKTMGGNQNG